MKPHRILQISRMMDRGGAETLIMNIYRNINRDKIQFDFLLFHPVEGCYEKEIRALGGQIFKLPYITEVGPISFNKKLFSFFNQGKYRIVHSHINEISAVILKQAFKAHVSVRIAHSHNYFPKYSLIEGIYRNYLRKEINRFVTHRFGCSSQALDWLFGKHKVNSAIVKNGAMLEWFKFQQQSNPKLVIGHIGSFSPQKNHKFIVEIFIEVIKLKPEATLKLVGEGSLWNSIKDLVKNVGLSERIKFLGIRSDIPELMSQFDLFLMPSLHEGLPLTLIEAQAVGTNCLISDFITEEVDVGCDLIHRMSLSNSPIEWAERAIEICENKKKNDNTHEFVKRAGFDIKDTSRWLEEFYLKV